MELDEDRCIKMNDGNKIPAVGFGTYSPDAVQKSKCEAATKVAIEIGFRHIDGAFVYETEEEVGRAVHEKIADGTVKREDIFYTGKSPIYYEVYEKNHCYQFYSDNMAKGEWNWFHFSLAFIDKIVY